MFVCGACLPEALLGVGQELQPRIAEDMALSVWCEPTREHEDRHYM